MSHSSGRQSAPRRRTLGAGAALAALLAAACSSMSPLEQTHNEPPRPVTMVGCVARASEPGRYVLRGLALDDDVKARTGSGPGQLQSTATLPGGDAIRNRSDLTPEEWASRITPELVGNADQVRALLGQRVVVIGTFVPAAHGQSLDRLRIKTLARVAPHCIDG